ARLVPEHLLEQRLAEPEECGADDLQLALRRVDRPPDEEAELHLQDGDLPGLLVDLDLAAADARVPLRRADPLARLGVEVDRLEVRAVAEQVAEPRAPKHRLDRQRAVGRALRPDETAVELEVA